MLICTFPVEEGDFNWLHCTVTCGHHLRSPLGVTEVAADSQQGQGRRQESTKKRRQRRQDVLKSSRFRAFQREPTHLSILSTETIRAENLRKNPICYSCTD